MSYQILFTDLDGTLLNSEGKISSASKAAAKKAIDAGKQIILCSGRSWMSLAFYEEPLGLATPGAYGVSFNGGIIYKRKNEATEREVLYQNTLPKAQSKKIISRLKELGADILVYAGSKLYAERATPFNEKYSQVSQVPIHMLKDFAEIEPSVIKILAEGWQEDLIRVYNGVNEEFKDDAYIVFSSPYLLEFGPTEAHKGNAVKFLARHLNVPLSQVIAMGDEDNDLTMLKTAGLGIAVNNATANAKAAAKMVSPYSNDEDAFARVIEEYLL